MSNRYPEELQSFLDECNCPVVHRVGYENLTFYVEDQNGRMLAKWTTEHGLETPHDWVKEEQGEQRKIHKVFCETLVHLRAKPSVSQKKKVAPPKDPEEKKEKTEPRHEPATELNPDAKHPRVVKYKSRSFDNFTEDEDALRRARAGKYYENL